MRARVISSVCVLGLTTVLASQADAAFNLYVNAVDADGNKINGDVTQKGYANDFTIGAFGIGVSRTNSGLQFTPLNTQGGVGGQSVDLFKAVVLNEPLKSLEVDIVNAGNTGIYTQASWAFTTVPVLSYTTAADTTAGTNTESVTYSYSKVVYTYNSYDMNGTKQGTEFLNVDVPSGQVTTATTGTVNDFQFLTGTLATGGTVTPEPASLGLLLMTGFGALRRRSRREGNA